MSDLEIGFLPMSEANSVLLTAKKPLDFDFGSSLLPMPNQEVIKASKESIRMRVMTEARVPVVIRINNVKLGYPGGPTVFDIQTFVENTRVDEKIDFVGFVLSGAVRIDDAMLHSEYQLHPARFPLKSRWAVQTSNRADARYMLAKASFKLHFSRPAYMGENFTVSVYPFVFAEQAVHTFKFYYQGHKHSTEHKDVELQNITVIGDTLQGVLMQDLRTPSGDPLFPGYNPALYGLEVFVVTPDSNHPDIAWWLGQSDKPPKFMWGFETRASPDMPSNTNDKTFGDFRLVRELGWRVHPGRCLQCKSQPPPGAKIDVAVRVDPLGTRPHYMIIAAPVCDGNLNEDGVPDCFNFTGPSCLARPQFGNIESCEPVLDIAGHAAVKLEATGNGLNVIPPGLVLSTLTPYSTPTNPAWYVTAYRRPSVGLHGRPPHPSDIQVGWAEATEGFEVVQMDKAGVILATLPNKRVAVAVGFSTRERYDVYAELTVSFPLNYIPECEDFNPLSLPIGVDSPKCYYLDDGEYLAIKITVNQTLPSGDYSFMITAIVPGTTPGLVEPEGRPPVPEKNMFNLVLRDKDLMVRDAAMRKPAPVLVFGIDLVPAPTLYWMTNPTCMISCATRKLVDIDFSLPSPPKEPRGLPSDIIIEWLLVELPAGATHRVSDARKERDVQTTFAFTRMDWRFTDRLGFDIDEMFGVGRHTISIPTNLPEFQSGHNIWYLSFCRDFCGNKRNESVMLTFPYAGFAPGDESPDRPGTDSHATLAGLLLVLLSSF